MSNLEHLVYESLYLTENQNFSSATVTAHTIQQYTDKLWFIFKICECKSTIYLNFIILFSLPFVVHHSLVNGPRILSHLAVQIEH